MKSTFETFGEFSAEWLREQRELVQRAIWRGWIKPTTNGPAPASESSPAVNVGAENPRRNGRKHEIGVSNKKPATLKSRA